MEGLVGIEIDMDDMAFYEAAPEIFKHYDMPPPAPPDDLEDTEIPKPKEEEEEEEEKEEEQRKKEELKKKKKKNEEIGEGEEISGTEIPDGEAADLPQQEIPQERIDNFRRRLSGAAAPGFEDKMTMMMDEETSPLDSPAPAQLDDDEGQMASDEQEDDGEKKKRTRKIFDRSRRFADTAVIDVAGGNGGNGCVSFRRESYQPLGGPNGGDGGRGGSVYFVSSENVTSLHGLRRHYRAASGENGRGFDQHGKSGEDLVIEVPVGTVARVRPQSFLEGPPSSSTSAFATTAVFAGNGSSSDPSEADDEEAVLPSLMRSQDYYKWTIVADLQEPGARWRVVSGGYGGKGNPHFASATDKAPRTATEGQKASEVRVHLELKTLADVGLVGHPNAGKSTLLSAISNAHPKVAPYPFTTLNPFIGVIEYPDLHQVHVADIPGIIPDAHRNRGLGHEFLRHIERSPVFVYVLDVAGMAPLTPLGALRFLQDELELHKPGLTDRPSIVVVNKMDLLERQQPSSSSSSAVSLEQLQRNLEELRENVKLPIVPISAAFQSNILELTSLLRKTISDYKAEKYGVKPQPFLSYSSPFVPSSSLSPSPPSPSPPSEGEAMQSSMKQPILRRTLKLPSKGWNDF